MFHYNNNNNIIKHPEPSIPPQSILTECDPCLSFSENVEITGNIIQRVASMIQGSAGPGGCDSNHWQDALLQYGAHSTTLVNLLPLWQEQLLILSYHGLKLNV